MKWQKSWNSEEHESNSNDYEEVSSQSTTINSNDDLHISSKVL
jgi:hypothetical protein